MNVSSFQPIHGGHRIRILEEDMGRPVRQSDIGGDAGVIKMWNVTGSAGPTIVCRDAGYVGDLAVTGNGKILVSSYCR